jgi:tRNA 2-thiouridine synthesizing protein A
MIEIDARGLRCPQPIIELGKKIIHLKSGDEVLLYSDDPATEPDLNAWARMTGNKFSIIEPAKFLITKN